MNMKIKKRKEREEKNEKERVKGEGKGREGKGREWGGRRVEEGEGSGLWIVQHEAWAVPSVDQVLSIFRVFNEAEARRVSFAINASIRAEQHARRKKQIVRLLLLGQILMRVWAQGNQRLYNQVNTMPSTKNHSQVSPKILTDNLKMQ
ncbi:hypothetical protein K443DRAFT_123886 [Laccaria amethystina LaAM-08-1]|uniref:Uncharacterized protein n=1 Tax=Laccaria amethystina LaAM-08-1 TaxID=1095629 RepID=A0A0C9X987_9AGAR|nr:hypothetical protein K443DRAFT_123886 [Laccaria amethystina LaAM-08-1]